MPAVCYGNVTLLGCLTVTLKLSYLASLGTLNIKSANAYHTSKNSINTITQQLIYIQNLALLHGQDN